MTDDQCALAMGAVAIDPVATDIVYAGTGDYTGYFGCGVLRSTDGGATWTQLGASSFAGTNGGARIYKLLVDPATAGSPTGTMLLAASDAGLYRSADSGTNWKLVLAGVASDVLLHPRTPSIVYAALGNPGFFGADTAANGIYKSLDGGQTWSKLTGFSNANIGRIRLAIAASSPQILYAGAQDTTPSNFGALRGVFKSADGGATWAQVAAANAGCRTFCQDSMYLAIDPTNPNTVYFGGQYLFKSLDGGITFTNIAGDSFGDEKALVFQPGDPNTLYHGNDGGIWKSVDAGAHWSSLNTNLAILQFYPGVAPHPSDPSVMLGGAQDQGVNLRIGSDVWTQLHNCDAGFAAIDFQTPTTAYAVCNWPGDDPYKTGDLGLNATFAPAQSGIDHGDRAVFIPPLVMSPADPQTLYFATYRLYRTTDAAQSWNAISGDLTKFGTNWSISAVALSRANPQAIYVGTGDGNVAATSDGGATWTMVVNGLPNRAVTDLALDPGNPENAFVTFSGFGAGHVFKTGNAGGNWSDISGNLPDIPVNAILLDPVAPAMHLFIGTDLGAFETGDGGAHWTPFGSGLPNVSVVDLAFNPVTGVLLAATHGRSVWEADIGSFVVEVARTGGGTVTSSPSGIDCGVDCRAVFPSGTAVSLAATGNRDWSFAGWGEACAGTSGCAVTIGARVTADFALGSYALAVSTSGRGRVVSEPRGIRCGSVCAADFAAGLNISLTAIAAPGWRLAAWNGACAGTGTCTVKMRADAAVGADFERR